MSEQRPGEIIVQDPLNVVTRKERKLLIAMSAIGITVVKAGIVPTKITALGIDFNTTNKQLLLYMIALSIGYFLVAFIIYAIADFVKWQIIRINTVRKGLYDFQAELRELLLEQFGDKVEDKLINKHMENTLSGHKVILDKLERQDNFTHIFVGPIAIVRGIFEFLFPIVLGVYAISALWQYPIK